MAIDPRLSIISAILYHIWDPLSVSPASYSEFARADFAPTGDEYDDYTKQILNAISTGIDYHGLMYLLQGFEQENMGLTLSDEEASAHTVYLLLDLHTRGII